MEKQENIGYVLYSFSANFISVFSEPAHTYFIERRSDSLDYYRLLLNVETGTQVLAKGTKQECKDKLASLAEELKRVYGNKFIAI